MDGLELLKNDHDAVNALFRQFEQGGNALEFETLFKQLNAALTLHTIIEEEVFYPMLRDMPETSNLIRDAYNEHGQAKQTLTKIAALDNTSTEWGQMMTTLMREIQQHVQEEEGTLFPKVRQLMSEQELQTLGMQLQQAKDKGITSAVLNDLTQQANAQISASLPPMTDNMGSMVDTSAPMSGGVYTDPTLDSALRRTDTDPTQYA